MVPSPPIIRHDDVSFTSMRQLCSSLLDMYNLLSCYQFFHPCRASYLHVQISDVVVVVLIRKILMTEFDAKHADIRTRVLLRSSDEQSQDYTSLHMKFWQNFNIRKVYT